MKYALILLSLLVPFAAGAQTPAGKALPAGEVSAQVRQSEAYAEAGNPRAALAAIEAAVKLAPDTIDILRRHAILATWAGEYGRAQESYRRLLRLSSNDVESMLGLARVSAWAGDTDAAVAMYRKYLQVRGDQGDVWIELARTEAWRGNFAASWEALDEYESRFGESTESRHERAAVLARGGRPRAATRLIDELLVSQPGDYGLTLSRTVALAAQQRRSEAIDAFATVERLRPEQPETLGARGALRVAVASTGEPRLSFYSDSDGLRVRRVDPRVSIGFANGTRVGGGYERQDLQARAGSGLEQVGGATRARHEITWIGGAQRVGRFTLRGYVGHAQLERDDRFVYELSARFASDRLQISADRESGYFVVSPRTVGLGITRLTHRAQLDWTPTFRYQVAFQGAYDELSDGNRRWDVLLVPRRVVARTQRFNLDLGVQLRQFGTTRNLENGYYDPSRYENYAVVAFPYWKVSENVGVAGAFAAGTQRDDSRRAFSFGGNAAVEVTVGIYQDWMLKVNGSTTQNDRLQSGAFRGYSWQAVLVRRF